VGNRAGSTPAPGTLKVRNSVVNQLFTGFFYLICQTIAKPFKVLCFFSIKFNLYLLVVYINNKTSE
jgi:hypothetical protein